MQNIRYFKRKTLPNVARIVNIDTGYVSGTIGQQPPVFNQEDWIDEGVASYAEAQAHVAKIFAEARKPNLKKDIQAQAKRLYQAVLAAGNSVELARQVSGYLGD